MAPDTPADAAAGQRPHLLRRRAVRVVLVAGVLLLLAAVALRVLLQPERVVRAALDQAGDALGLEITAGGVGEYRLRGTPMVMARDVVARAPGASTPVLTAERVEFSLPWSTLRGRFRELQFSRVELDAPVLDIGALQAWRDTRPPGTGRLPALREGLGVRDGTIVSGGWTIDGLDLAVPRWFPGNRATGTVRGRLAMGATRVPFDLHVVLAEAGPETPLGAAGTATLLRGDWSMPARLTLSGMLGMGDGGWSIAPVRLAAEARYRSGGLDVPFALGIAGALRSRDGELALRPAGVALRPRGAPVGTGVPENPVPRMAGGGELVVADGVELALAGTVDRWPEAWPALPAPLAGAAPPLPFELGYAGSSDFADPVRLRASRGDARFDGRLRLPALASWLDEDGSLSPLPPVDGRAWLPTMELGGATLHGVEIVVDDHELGEGPAGAPRTDD